MNMSERPTMEELRNLSKFPFEQFNSDDAPMQVIKAWQQTLASTVPANPTEDFYVGVEWLLSFLYILANRGLYVSIQLLGDLGIALLMFKQNEENPFEDRLHFDSEIRTLDSLESKLLETIKNLQRKEKDDNEVRGQVP